jgi:hypothetical protein
MDKAEGSGLHLQVRWMKRHPWKLAEDATAVRFEVTRMPTM